MLSFASRSVSEKTLLANTNALLQFTPSKITHNTLLLTKDGEIVVTIRKAISFDSRKGTEALSSKSYDKSDSFSEEKMILFWHFSSLLPYLKLRFEHLKGLPKKTLHQYYDYSTQIQGFYQLCNNLLLHFSALKNEIEALEKPQAPYWTIEFLLTQKNLNSLMTECEEKFKTFVQKIATDRRELLTITRAHHLMLVAPVLRVAIDIPLEQQKTPAFKIARIGLNGASYQVKASFEDLPEAWTEPATYPFSGKLCLTIKDESGNSHCELKLYPSWSTDLLPQPSPYFALPPDCATGYVQKQYQSQSKGVIPLQNINLVGKFTFVCSHVTSDELLPFFMSMTAIANKHHCEQIIFYAPYNYSAILYAYGFYIASQDDLTPTIPHLKETVEQCFEQGNAVPILAGHNRRSTEGDNILRPFSLEVAALQTRPVYLTKQKTVTTYAKLIEDHLKFEQDYTKGVFPEVHQLPLRFVGPMFSLLQKRELSGKLSQPAVAYGMQPVDYCRLAEDKKLADVALADPTQAEESQYKRMFTLSRK